MGRQLEEQISVSNYALAGFTCLVVVDVAEAVAVLDNGFWTMAADQGFHLGLWGAMAAFGFLIITSR